MGFLIKLAGGALALAVGLFALVMVASETGGEVVTLRTYDEGGAQHETSLWIVEDHNQLYLRAGQPGSGWLARLKARSEVEVERDGVTKTYRAVVAPGMGPLVNERMAEKYGWADTLVGLMRDSGQVTAVRLELLRAG